MSLRMIPPDRAGQNPNVTKHYTSAAGPKLEERHRKTLVEGSAIDPEVIAERGVRSIGEGSELPREFSWRQRRRAPGILFKLHRPGGGTSWVFRPDEPDPKNPGYKYAQPPKGRGGMGNVLDVHPRTRPLLDAMSVPLLFTEGVKKADAITSAAKGSEEEIVAVAISGVYNWMSGGEAIPDMRELPIEGRVVYVCFDSDMLTNPNVQEAAERLAGWLGERGAEAWIVYLPDRPDGSKNGADDFLANGGTLEELMELARPFDPEDLQRKKLSADEMLRRALEDLKRRHDAMPTKSRGDCSKRAAFRGCVGHAERYGSWAGDGVQVRIDARTGGERMAASHMTFARKMRELVEEGQVRRVEGESREEPHSYVLLTERAVLLHTSERQRKGAKVRGADGNPPHGVTKPRAPLPELREPYVQTVREKDRRGRLVEAHEYVARLGKRRGEVVRFLLERDGYSTLPELMGRFAGAKTRPRDFKRRLLADLLGHRRQYHGQPLGVGPPIIQVEGDTVRLSDGWREALEHHRALGGEPDAAIRQKANHLRQRAAYRKRNATKPDRAPTEEEMAAGREARQKRLRIEELAAAGMRLDFAAREVIGADGYVEDLSPAEEPVPEPVPEPEHSLACECPDCAATVPTYVRLT